MEKTYNPHSIEETWYQHWEDKATSPPKATVTPTAS